MITPSPTLPVKGPLVLVSVISPEDMLLMFSDPLPRSITI